MRLLLKNLRIYRQGADHQGDIRIEKGKILETGSALAPRRREQVLNASGYLALPGLINAHDHLELDLFPHLGKPPYPNFYAWARDIYRPGESPMHAIQQVDLSDRLWWGGYRNLISGVTTVVHHNPYYGEVFDRDFPVKVLKRYAWAHSLGYGNNLFATWRRSRGKPFVIHAAEGSDLHARQEINRLKELGLLAPNTVLVHGVALSVPEVDCLSRAGVSVVWCPSSNLHLYGATAPIDLLRDRIAVALGTDSTLSGSPTLWDELRVARSTGLASPTELLGMVTVRAAAIFALAPPVLEAGSRADLILLPETGRPAAESLLAATPQELMLVLVDGLARLADPALASQLELPEAQTRVAGRLKWVCGDLKNLRRRILQQVSHDILHRNPLWSLLGPEPA